MAMGQTKASQAAVLEVGRPEEQSGALSSFLLRYGILLATLALIVFFGVKTENFLTVTNILDILRSVSILVIVALGFTMSLTVNGMDVSVGAVTGLAVLLAPALMVIWEVPWPLAVLITLIAGAAVGLLNALLLVTVRIPDLLATLGVMYLVQGLQMSITKADSVYRGMTNPWSPDRAIAPGGIAGEFLELGGGFVFAADNFRGIPVPVIVMAVLAVLLYIFLAHTRYGRTLYAVGGNMEA